MLNVMASGPGEVLAAMMAARKLQVASQVSSPGSAAVVTS
jgi:hypothetical protein